MRSKAVRAIAIAAALVLLFVLAGCSPAPTGGTSPTPPATGGSTGGGAAAGGTTITEQNFAFNPSTATVKVGDTVTFKNADTAPHRVVVGTKDLGEQAPGQDVTWTADKAGTIDVKCSIHPSMTAQITVQ